MDSILCYGEAQWFCNAHGDFSNTVFEADTAKFALIYRDVRSCVEAKAACSSFSVCVYSTRVALSKSSQ